MAVAVLEALGQLVLGEAGDLLEHLAGGVGVDGLVRPRAEDVTPAQHLEEVELDVAQVALVVAHGRGPPDRVSERLLTSVLPTGNKMQGVGCDTLTCRS